MMKKNITCTQSFAIFPKKCQLKVLIFKVRKVQKVYLYSIFLWFLEYYHHKYQHNFVENKIIKDI